MWNWLGNLQGDMPPDAIWAKSVKTLPYAEALLDTDRKRLRELARRFLRDKTFEGARGLEVTDAMRTTVALQACLLVLNLDLTYYAGWHAIILYPGDFRVHKEEMDETGVVHQWTEELSGESWEHGPVILSWDAAAATTPGFNIVLHEFAHKLDMLNGTADGCPPLPPEIEPQRWTREFADAYEKFCNAAGRNESLWMDPYAAESPAEFFAVLSEQFFLQPDGVWKNMPTLYDLLRSFYRQDPLTVMAPP